MAWRVQLSESNIKRLDILSGRPSLLAAWVRTTQVIYLELQQGVQKAEATFTPPEAPLSDETAWTAFLDTLRAPNNAWPPFLRLKNGASLNLTNTGAARLYHDGGKLVRLIDHTPPDSEGLVWADEPQHDLDVADPLVVTMERGTGFIAVLDRTGQVHLFDRSRKIGAFDSTLVISDDFRPTLLVTKGSARVILSDGANVVILSEEGKVSARMQTYFAVGAINASSDGRRIVVSDLDANLIRIYSGTNLRPTHQRFAVDLMAEAKRVQLLTTAEPTRSALGPLAINSKGVLAFAVAGSVCVTSLARMKAVPRMSV